MNERYLFRGKRMDNGEWVKGFYSRVHIIIDGTPQDNDWNYYTNRCDKIEG